MPRDRWTRILIILLSIIAAFYLAERLLALGQAFVDIIELLALVGLRVMPKKEAEANKLVGLASEEVTRILKDHLELLLEAEHVGWWQQKRNEGFRLRDVKNNDLKHHDAMIHMSEFEKEFGKETAEQYRKEDEKNVLGIPGRVDMVDYVIVPIMGYAKEEPGGQ